MGFMDKFSKMLGGKKPAEAEPVKGPSQVLREQGIDPSNLKFMFHSSGSIAISGNVDSQAECDRVCDILKDMPNVTGVQNDMVVVAPAPATVPEPEPTVEVETVADEAAPEDADSGQRTYTVQSGDTLSAIARQFYGSSSKYMKIFNANTHLLDNPDRIRPGQVLIIPDE